MSQATDNMNKSLLEHAEYLGVPKESKAANLLVGAQLGVGFQPNTIDAATPIVYTPTVLVVLQTPTMYNDKPEIGRMIKAVIESHAKAVSGLEIGYTVDTGSQPAGHDGQEMEVPLATKRSAPSPSFTFQEVTGNLIWNLFRRWMWDINHPDTNASMIDLPEDQTKPFVMSAYSMSMLAIQFDPTMLPKNIIDAVYYTNMFPKDIGSLGIERTIGTSKVVERSVTFSAIAQHNDYTVELAKEIATELQLAKINYSKIKTGITGVESAVADSGLKEQAKQALDTMASE